MVLKEGNAVAAIWSPNFPKILVKVSWICCPVLPCKDIFPIETINPDKLCAVCSAVLSSAVPACKTVSYKPPKTKLNCLDVSESKAWK